MTSLPRSVRIVEVGARDGLQNQPSAVSTAHKVELIERLCDTGIRHIEAGAFVSPKWIPTMADSAEVMRLINRKDDVVYSTLTPNLKGMEAALEAKASEVAVFISATESFSMRNTNCSIEEALARAQPVISLAKQNDIRVRGYISCVLGCPWEGDDVDQSKIADFTVQLLEMGCFEVSLGDTIGRGTPGKVKSLIAAITEQVDASKIAAHFHNTYGQALANIYAALEMGVCVVDSSVAGLGGCPYARGATGNVATEDVIYMLNGLGIETGVDLDKMVDVACFIQDTLGIKVDSNASRAIKTKRLA
ncbi:MAG: isopropylmalate/homocitrate/citramalate synthase [Candidatus Azotimanducaceae bacterium]|jgi:isopropylmalate/homocitrate/citramalate synthase